MSYPNLMVINELLQEYFDRRIESSKSWLGSFDVAYSAITSKANSIAGIEDIRKELEKDFSEAHEAATNEKKAQAWVEIIIKLGSKAHSAQNLTKNHSHFCETLHAIRSYILNHSTNFPELKTQIDAGKEKLRTDLGLKLKEIDIEKSDSNVSIVKKEGLCIERDILYRNLGYLDENKELLSLESDQLNKLFPYLEIPQRPSVGSLVSKDQNTKYDLPFVLQKNYIQHYVNKYFNKKGREFSLREIEHTLMGCVCRKYGFEPHVVARFYVYQPSLSATPILSGISSSMSPLVLAQTPGGSQLATPRTQPASASSGMILSAINALPKPTLGVPPETDANLLFAMQKQAAGASAAAATDVNFLAMKKQAETALAAESYVNRLVMEEAEAALAVEAEAALAAEAEAALAAEAEAALVAEAEAALAAEANANLLKQPEAALATEKDAAQQAGRSASSSNTAFFPSAASSPAAKETTPPEVKESKKARRKHG